MRATIAEHASNARDVKIACYARTAASARSVQNVTAGMLFGMMDVNLA